MTFSSRLLRAVAAICLVSGVGAQQAALPPPPGKLVDIGGGRRLHLHCTGQGVPTVVLEAGAASYAIDWTLVQRQMERTDRVCSYDRAGMGWSDQVKGDERTDQDLRQVLRSAGERPPFVLVGASRGGLLIRRFLLDHRADVVGLVFVDPASEDRLFTMINGKAVLIASATADQLKTTFPSGPLPMPRGSQQFGPPFDRLPPDLYKVRLTLDERLIGSAPRSLPPEVVARSQENERQFLARLLASRSETPLAFGGRPTVVLSRGDHRNAEWEKAHEGIARLSTNSRHTVVAGAGHEIHLFEPGVVVQAITDVVQSIRQKTPLPKR